MAGESVRRGPGRPAILNADLICETAMSIIEDTGELRLEDLGKKLGVDTSAVYRHFRNKSDLVNTIAERFAEPLLGRLPTTGDWRADFEAEFRRVESHYRERPNVAALVMSEGQINGRILQLTSDGIDILRRSGASERALFTAMHAVEVSLFGLLRYDTVGGSNADSVRRAYHSRVGSFEVDAMFPTAEDFAEESNETLWILVGAALDWLENQVRML